MCDLHQVIVNHVGKMIRRKAISLQEDEVVLGVLLLKAAVDNITYGKASKDVALEAYDMALTLSGSTISLARVDGAARLAVDGRLAGLMLLASLRLQLLLVAEAAVCVAGVDELLDMALVYV